MREVDPQVLVQRVRERDPRFVWQARRPGIREARERRAIAPVVHRTAVGGHPVHHADGPIERRQFLQEDRAKDW